MNTVIRYTTSPEVHDGFGTKTTIADCGKDGYRTIRQVAIDADHVGAQVNNYTGEYYWVGDQDAYDRARAMPWFVPPLDAKTEDNR